MMIGNLIMPLAVLASAMLVTSLINPIDYTSQQQQQQQQQYVFAQENSTIVSPSNKTSTNTTFFPQIHNYTSSGLAPVNSWIIETKNGVVVVDTQRQFSEAKKLLNEVEKINKPILGVIITHP